MLRVVVDNRVRLDPKGLPEALLAELREAFTHKNPKRSAMKASGVKGWWSEPPIIPTWGEAEDGVLNFPRGGMSKVRDLLRKHAVDFRVQDRRVRFEPEPSTPGTKCVLRGYQCRCVAAATATENCLFRSGTGSGKTVALLAFYGERKVPTLVIVNSVALAEQWMGRAAEELGIDPDDVGLLGDGKRRIRHLTVGTPQSINAAIKRDPEFVNRWGAVLVDEVHLFAARTLFAVVDKFPARYRVGASDDERRKDKLEFLIYDLFGSVAAEVGDQELIDARAVLEVEVLIVPSDYEADWYACGDDDDKKPDFGVLVREMAADPARNEIIERIIATELADGRQMFVFGKERDQCRMLGMVAQQRAATGYLIGGSDYRKEFRRTVAGMKAGKIRVGVGTYQACGASLDIPTAEVGVAAAPCLANRTTFRQGRGRLCRAPLGKSVARFYIVWDRAVFGLRHVENAARWNAKTYVWDGGAWVHARDFLKRERIAAKKEANDGEAQGR